MWLPPALAALTLIPTHTWIHGGPAFAASRLIWTTNTAALYSSGPVRRMWHAPTVTAPLVQRVESVAASPRRVAFIRRVELVRKCDGLCPHGPRPVVRSDVLAGEPGGPFERINRGLALDVDVDGDRLLYSDTNKVVLQGETLASSQVVEFADVALAGRYAAWTEVPAGRNYIYVRRALVVYDLHARHVAYRLAAAPFVDIDLAPDGTVAFGQDPTPTGGPDGGIGWASSRQPYPHYLPGNAIPFEVRLAGRRVAFFTRGQPSLTLQSLKGRVVFRREAAYGGFDVDGRRLAYLSSPKTIAVERLK